MDNFYRLFPIFITFIVVVNVIQSIIKLIIGNDNEGKKKGLFSGLEEKGKNLMNNDWKLADEDENINSNDESNVENDFNDKNTDKENSKIIEKESEDNFINKKGRMEDYMDDKDESLYERDKSNKIIKAIENEKHSSDFPDEIKIGENSLFSNDNLKEDIIKGIVMKEILDKPRSINKYKAPLER